jgi:hypothetical protein
MNEHKASEPFRPTHLLRLHRNGARVTIPVVANGSFQSLTPLFTHSEWLDGSMALWTFDPVVGLLYRGASPTDEGWERSELVPIATLTEGGLQ